MLVTSGGVTGSDLVFEFAGDTAGGAATSFVEAAAGVDFGGALADGAGSAATSRVFPGMTRVVRDARRFVRNETTVTGSDFSTGDVVGGAE